MLIESSMLRSKRFLRIVLIAALLPAGVVGYIFTKAFYTARQASSDAASASRIAFTAGYINVVAPSGVDPIGTPASFRSIAVLDDRMYVSGPAGLIGYDRDGRMREQYRPGIELPSAALGSMAVGLAPDTHRKALFIATEGEGVLEFDGHRFRGIRADVPELRDITAVLPLSTGQLLMGTHKRGLLAFDGAAIRPFHDQLANKHITALAGTDADVWIGTIDSGVYHSHAGQVDALGSALPDPQVLSIAVDGQDAYVGTPLGVVQFRDGRKLRSLADGYFAKSLVASHSELLIGTQDEGINSVQVEGRGRAEAFQTGAHLGAIYSLADVAGGPYAVAADGIYTLDSGVWKLAIPRPPAVLADRNISALGMAPDGRVWVGYFDRGLDILSPDLQHVRHLEDDHLFCINRIAFSPGKAKARSAVATANGLVMFDPNGEPRQILGRKDGLLADHVTDVAFRGDGMAIATPAGISFVDSGGVRSLYVFHGLVNNHVYSIAAEGSRTLAGTLGGISVLEGDNILANYTTANSGLKHNWITGLARVGNDWFAGTYGAGVMRLDANGQWHSFPDLRGGFIVNPNAMLATRDRVYVGSLESGLYIYDIASSRWTHTNRGLPSVNVTSLAEDRGYLFVGTDNGIVRLNEGALR